MLARLDEFDSLTPLISTPSASNASDSLITQQVDIEIQSIVGTLKKFSPNSSKISYEVRRIPLHHQEGLCRGLSLSR